MQSKAQNAVNPCGLTSILTRQCEKSALKKRVRIYSRLPKHIILWLLSDELSDSEKAEVTAAAKENLEGLKGKIDGLEDIKVITLKLASSNADMMLDSTFVSEQVLRAYSSNPAHVAVADKFVRPYIQTRSCIDFEI